MVSTFLLGALGCSSTVTLGPKANEKSIVDAKLGGEGVGVTVPFVNVSVSPSKTEEGKAKTTTKKNK